MAANDRIKIEIDVDGQQVRDEIASIGGAAGRAGGIIQDAFGAGAGRSFAAVAGSVAVVGASLFALKGAADLAYSALVKADEIKALNAQFEALAASAGESAQVLREAFVGATDGLVDDEDVIRSANRALGELGEFATQLPGLLEVARKTSAAFGGEVTENFEAITRAVATGNTRQLKSIGLFIDSKKAVDDYARSIGVTSDVLSEQGRRQAVLNAVLEKSSSALKTVNTEALENTNAFKRLGVAAGNVLDAIAVGFDRVFGDTSRRAANGFAGFLNAVSDNLTKAFGSEQESKLIKINEQQRFLAQQNRILASQYEFIEKNRAWLEQSNQLAGVLKRTEDVAASIEKTKARLKELGVVEAVGPQLPANIAAEREGAGVTGRAGDVDLDKLAQARAAFEKELAALNSSRIAAELAVVNALPASFAREQELRRINLEQIDAINRDYDLREASAQEKAKTDRLFSEQFLNDTLVQINAERAAKIRAITDQLNADIGNESLTAAQAFSETLAGFDAAANEFALSAQKNFQTAGKALFQFAGQGAGQAFAAFGKAIATGQNAIGAFLNSLLASFGQAAIQLGTNFILQGIAYQWAGLPNGGPLIAAGAALATFGGALSALGGGSSAGAATGGAGSTIDTTPPALEDDAIEEGNGNRSRVTINVTGSIFDSESTGLRIVELIQNAFDQNGAAVVTRT